MGIKIKIKEIVLEIEYILIITLLISSISNTIMNYLSRYYICLLFVIYHEIAHILIATVLNKKLRKVFISVCGMTAYFKYEFKNKDRLYYIIDFLIFIAGPVSNLIIAILFNKVSFVFEINMFIAILNLLPIYPLDGFCAFKALLNSIFIKSKNNIIKISRYISVIFLIILSIFCIVVFFYYKNISSIIFLIYILLLNIKK